MTPEIRGLAMGRSLALAAVDVVYPFKGRVSPVSLMDAVAELASAATWLKRRPRRGLLARCSGTDVESPGSRGPPSPTD